MATLTVTLEELVNRAQFDLIQPGGQGMQVVLADPLTADLTDKTFTLQDGGGVNPTDIVEFGDELLLITAKTDDAVPVFTCARAYFNTKVSAHTNELVGHVNPTYPRIKIAEAIRRSFPRLEALGVPLIKVASKSRVEGYSYFEAPEDAREIYEILFWGSDGRLLPLGGWEFFPSLTQAKFSTGKSINLGNYVEDVDELEIVYRAAYRWSTHPLAPTPDATIEIPEGAEDLPLLYAAAWLASSREVSRSEIDRAEEWTQTAPLATGISSSVVKSKWQEFYRALDEARRLQPAPQRIHFRRRPRF